MGPRKPGSSKKYYFHNMMIAAIYRVVCTGLSFLYLAGETVFLPFVIIWERRLGTAD